MVETFEKLTIVQGLGVALLLAAAVLSISIIAFGVKRFRRSKFKPPMDFLI